MALEIPIFLLKTVLFPGASLELRIFEPRYREMVAYCLEHGLGFGVVLIRSGEEVGENAEPHDVGTLARIARSERSDDGRYEISVTGTWRFRILARDTRSQSYQVADVEGVAEDEGPPDGVLRDLAADLLAEHKVLSLALTDRWWAGSRREPDAVGASYAVSAALAIGAAERQRLLEAVDARERLKLGTRYLERQVGVLRAQVALYHRQKLQGFGAEN